MTTPAHDDWDAHWATYGDASGELNPANRMRERTILGLLGTITPGATVLDIGSGQGDLVFFLARRRPDVNVVGVENSTEGVARARRRAETEGVSATFIEQDLLVTPPADAASIAASYATCSEVLEHVDDPSLLLRNASAYLAPGCRIVITVPGGPRSAFDRHIGHRRHFTPAMLAGVIEGAGLEVVRTARTGFPFFNLYKVLTILRGDKLIRDVESFDPTAPPSERHSPPVRAVLRALEVGFRCNLPPGPLGWQIVGVARRP